MNNEDEIFTKHYCENKTISVEFNDETITANKKLLNEFKQHNLIKQNHHFSIEDVEDEENKYFENVIDSTLKNQSLYCSYLDYFDKMWMSNNTTSK
jgi:capsule polysaccharide export protein KpsC/LpsZ